MKRIAVTFTYYTDIISVPDLIENSISEYQKMFDEWLYDKSNDHDYWVIINGQKKAVSFDTSAFVEYLNNNHLHDKEETATIIIKEAENIPENIKTIYF